MRRTRRAPIRSACSASCSSRPRRCRRPPARRRSRPPASPSFRAHAENFNVSLTEARQRIDVAGQILRHQAEGLSGTIEAAMARGRERIDAAGLALRENAEILAATVEAALGRALDASNALRDQSTQIDQAAFASSGQVDALRHSLGDLAAVLSRTANDAAKVANDAGAVLPRRRRRADRGDARGQPEGRRGRRRGAPADDRPAGMSRRSTSWPPT